MKKKLLTFLALICALCFVFSFAACDRGNDDGGSGNGSGSGSDQSDEQDDPNVDAKMSEKAWQTCMTAFGEATNFTLTETNVKRNVVINICKNDGTKHLETGFYRPDPDREKSSESAYEAKDGKYYSYEIEYYANGQEVENPTWTKTELTEEQFKEDATDSFYFERDLLAATLKAHYADLTYSSGGIYTLAEAYIEDPEYSEFAVKDVVVTVTSGKVSKISLVADFLGKLDFTDFGTTTVNVPTV